MYSTVSCSLLQIQEMKETVTQSLVQHPGDTGNLLATSPSVSSQPATSHVAYNLPEEKVINAHI